RSYLDQARAHISLSEQGTEADPVGSFQLAYDAGRKALASLLVAQGLRPTSKGGHLAIQDAVDAQFTPGLEDVVRHFRWMRRVRNDSEYPSAEHPVATSADAMKAQEYARAMADAASRLLGALPAF